MLIVFRNLFYLIVFSTLLLIVGLFMYAQKLKESYHLDAGNLDGALWSMPAHVYARPLELYTGAKVSMDDLENELNLLKFQKVDNPVKTNQYSRHGNQIIYYAEAFHFWDVNAPARKMEILFEGQQVQSVNHLSALENVAWERLNPLHIASIYPSHKQDRILVSLDEVPPALIDALIALEDKRFWSHIGIDAKGIIRSFYITLIAKSGRQGASTLTQQFIKNHYLSNEQTLSRKIKEILMALVLERYRSKHQILEAYINEIYLGQDGQRAIHGFGLASEYYFNKKLADLNLHEIALLMALVREPGSADPRARPEYALQRRNFILQQMQEHQLISEADRLAAQALPLDVVQKESVSERVQFPAFVDLVYRQLSEYYSAEDLTREGLNIFTTLDPQVQQKAQQAVSEALPRLEKANGLKKNHLQSAAVVVDVGSGEVTALVGSRVPNELGFNRALNAKRQAGSVIKPAVYLSALEYPQRYNVMSLLDDSPLNYKGWKPKNYSRTNKGRVPLHDSLVRSYNIPTARIALDLGIEDIISTLKRLGIRSDLPAYPSLSLGAVGLTPLEIAQMYETLANDGYYTPLRAIREITTKEGSVVKRFEMSNTLAIMPAPHYLLVSILQDVPRRGTATAMKEKISPDLNIAGKTGTTDNYRDSWFAGFSANILTVVWVGNDQNQGTKLSGGKGALRVWMDIMKPLPNEALQLKVPDDIVKRTVDVNSGLLAGSGCRNTRSVAFIRGSEPRHYQTCYVAEAEEDAYSGSIPDFE